MGNEDLALKLAREWILTQEGELSAENELKARGLAELLREYDRQVNFKPRLLSKTDHNTPSLTSEGLFYIRKSKP